MAWMNTTNKTDDWLTPPHIVRSLGHFDLDPASSRNQSWKLADEEYKWPGHDGLTLPWRGRVWLNPPFSETKKWVRRMILHNDGILLIPARVETEWFALIWQHATAILFPQRRIDFIRHGVVTKQMHHAMAICAFGDEENAHTLERCYLGGILVWRSSYLTIPPREVSSSCIEEDAKNGNANRSRQSTGTSGANQEASRAEEKRQDEENNKGEQDDAQRALGFAMGEDRKNVGEG